MPATDILLVHDDTYEVLKATNRLDDTLFVFIVRYSVNDDGEETEKETNFYFKVVSEKQYDAYKDVKKMDISSDEDGEIKHPKKQN